MQCSHNTRHPAVSCTHIKTKVLVRLLVLSHNKAHFQAFAFLSDAHYLVPPSARHTPHIAHTRARGAVYGVYAYDAYVGSMSRDVWWWGCGCGLRLRSAVFGKWQMASKIWCLVFGVLWCLPLAMGG
jgi:hypothetical protein